MKKKKLYKEIETFLYDKQATLEEIKNNFKDQKSSKVEYVINQLVKDGKISEYKGKYCDYDFVYFM